MSSSSSSEEGEIKPPIEQPPVLTLNLTATELEEVRKAQPSGSGCSNSSNQEPASRQSSSRTKLVDQAWMKNYTETNTIRKTPLQSVRGGTVKEDTCVECNKYERLNELFLCEVCKVNKQHRRCSRSEVHKDQCNFCALNIARTSSVSCSVLGRTGQGTKQADFKNKGPQIGHTFQKKSSILTGKRKSFLPPLAIIESGKVAKADKNKEIELRIPKLSSSKKAAEEITSKPSMDKGSSSHQPRQEEERLDRTGGGIQRLGGEVTEIKKQLTIIEGGMQRLVGGIERLEGEDTKIKEQLTIIEGGIERLEGEDTKIKEQLTIIEGGIERLEGEDTKIKEQLTIIEGGIERLEGEDTKIKEQLTIIEGGMHRLMGENTEIKEQLTMIVKMLSQQFSSQNPTEERKE